MNDAEFQQLLETARRRPLAPAEERRLHALLAASPERQTVWNEEIALTALLVRLPAAPVPSNFTARVLAAVEREETAAARVAPSFDWLRRWRLAGWQPAALGALAVVMGLFLTQGYRVHQRTQMGRSLAAISTATRVPTVEALQDFEAIRRLGQAPRADEDLLTLFPPPQ